MPLLLMACGGSPEPERAPQRAEAPPPDIVRPDGFVQPGAKWEVVAQGYVYTDSPVAGPGDEVYFAAPIRNFIYRIPASGEIEPLDTDTEMTMGLTAGADGLIYGCRNRGAAIVVYGPDGNYRTLLRGEMTPLPGKPNAPGEFCNDVAVTGDGNVYFTDRINRKVMLLSPDARVRNGIVLSADESTLVVTDSIEPRLHAFSINPDGSLTEKPGFFDPIPTVGNFGGTDIEEGRPGTNGATVDSEGRYYVAAFYGILIYAPDGKYIGAIDRPRGFVSNLVFAGADRDMLYATGTSGVWRLPMLVRGVK